MEAFVRKGRPEETVRPEYFCFVLFRPEYFMLGLRKSGQSCRHMIG